MEQPTTAPATRNTIRGAEQSDNIAKPRLLGWWKWLEAVHDLMGGLIPSGRKRDIAIASRQLA